MSWLFSQALVEESLEGTFLTATRSAQLNVMPTQRKFWHRDKTIEHSNLSQYGLTSRLLTEPYGKVVLTSYLEDFPAKTYPRQGQTTTSTELSKGLKGVRPDYGESIKELLMKFNLVLSSLRTPTTLEVEDLTPSSKTLTAWCIMLHGVCWGLGTIKHRTKESGSGLWREYKRIIDEVQPSFVFIENSHNLRSRGLDTILKDLNGLVYNAAWGVLGAGDNKAPHQRKRLWIMAADTNGAQWERGWLSSRGFKKNPNFRLGSWWETEPKICRVDDGVANRVDRLIAIGNGQVPSVAERAFTTLASILEHTYEKEKEQSESTSGL